jgi:hypothetical protein
MAQELGSASPGALIRAKVLSRLCTAALATMDEADPTTGWGHLLIERGEAVRKLLPAELMAYFQSVGVEMG